ncbi:MAG: hypothetical protein ACYTGX_01505 [Planctomycetota bacterium]|jgi:hypothetical protein
MRVLAAVGCLFAAGCSTSLGITVPGPAHFTAREARPPVQAAPVPRIELAVARESLSLTATARSWRETASTGDFRRTQPALTYAIPYSLLVEQVELVLSAALLPPLVPILLYQMVWWVWSRGLTDEQRAELDAPFGSGYRDASLQALWPGCNVTAFWAWRAALLELDDPAVGAWRRRTVRSAEPVRGAVQLTATAGEGPPAQFRATAGSDGTARWTLNDLSPQGDAPIVLRARSESGTAELALPAAYWRAAREAAALRTALAATPANGTAHATLARLYETAGGFALARAELERAAAEGHGAGELPAAMRRLWAAEARAHRADGRTRAALFATAVRPLQDALLSGTASLEPLEAAPEAAAGRLTGGLLRERVHNALAWARHTETPPPVVGNALLATAGDFTAPVAAWAALRACIAHPQPAAPEVLRPLLAEQIPTELQRLAAQAILAAAPSAAVSRLARFASSPGVHWALNDATGANLPPVPADWAAWSGTEAWKRQWDAAARRYVTRRDR